MKLFAIDMPPEQKPGGLYVCVTPSCARFEQERRGAYWQLGRLLTPRCLGCNEHMRVVETGDGEWPDA